MTESESSEQKIKVGENEVEINNLKTSEEDVVNFFSDIEPEQREEKILNALRLGVIALKSSQTAQNVDYVEKRFNSLQQKFDDRIEDFEDEVDGFLGEDGELLKEFDPNEDGSPLKQLKTAVDERFDNLHDELLQEETEEELKEKTTLKGDDFEDQLEAIISPIVNTTGDKLRATGEETGELGESKVGDFVIELANPNEKVVIEAKNASNYSQPKIEEEMDEAIENRAAEYGIFIAKKQSQIPNKIGVFNEYNQDQLVITATEDGETIRKDHLEIAIKWARMRITQMKESTGDDIDTEEAQTRIESAERTLKNFSQIKTSCTNIETQTDKIREKAEETREQLEKELEEVNVAITSK